MTLTATANYIDKRNSTHFWAQCPSCGSINHHAVGCYKYTSSLDNRGCDFCPATYTLNIGENGCQG